MLRHLQRYSSLSHRSLRELNRNHKFQSVISQVESSPNPKTPEIEVQYAYAKSHQQLIDNYSPVPSPPKYGTESRPLLINWLGMSIQSRIFTGSLIFFLIYQLLIDKKQPPNRVEAVKVSFKDIKGVDECLKELEEIVLILKHREKYQKIGAKVPKGILLTGEPGTGKTLLAKAIAGEAGVSFFSTSGSEFDEVYVGVGAKRIRDLFQNAKIMAPSIVFIDEIDSIGESRKEKYSIYHKQSLNQLLVEMDGFDTKDNVVVIAATNIPERLDEALKRPGRFDKEVNIPIPSLKSRKEILDLYLGKISSEDLNSQEIAKTTIGFTGADLANLINTAMQIALKAGRRNCSMIDIENAKDRIILGIANRSVEYSYEENLATALYEAGKAITILYTKAADPLHKTSILRRGKQHGKTSQVPDKDKVGMNKLQSLAALDIKMAGKVMHELVYSKDQQSTIAETDVISAGEFAHKLIMEGMFEDLCGLAFYENKDELGPRVKNLVDSGSQKLVEESRNRLKKLLGGKIEIAKAIAGELIEKETLTREEVIKIVSRFDRSFKGME